VGMAAWRVAGLLCEYLQMCEPQCHPWRLVQPGWWWHLRGQPEPGKGIDMPSCGLEAGSCVLLLATATTSKGVVSWCESCHAAKQVQVVCPCAS
jgi:hypothetical protein